MTINPPILSQISIYLLAVAPAGRCSEEARQVGHQQLVHGRYVAKVEEADGRPDQLATGPSQRMLQRVGALIENRLDGVGSWLTSIAARDKVINKFVEEKVCANNRACTDSLVNKTCPGP